MKHFALIAQLFLATQVFGDVLEPLGPLNIVVFHDFDTYSYIDLEEGTFHDCDADYGDDIALINCKISGGSIYWTGWGEPTEIEITDVKYRYFIDIGYSKTEEYKYIGTWQKEVGGVPMRSKVILTLRYIWEQPDLVRGTLELEDLSTTFGVQASWR